MIDRAHHIVANIPVGVDPKRTMVSADGSRVYVTGYDGSMSIINAVDHTVRTVGGQASTAEAISPHDNYVYLVHDQGRNCWVSAISDDGTTATVVPVHSYASALTLSPDGGRLYVASSKPRSTYQHGHGSISVIDTATFTLIEVIAMQFSPDTIIVSPDGSAVYATHYNENAISAIELASRCHTPIGLDDAPLEVAVSPDGDQLYVTKSALGRADRYRNECCGKSANRRSAAPTSCQQRRKAGLHYGFRPSLCPGMGPRQQDDHDHGRPR